MGLIGCGFGDSIEDTALFCLIVLERRGRLVLGQKLTQGVIGKKLYYFQSNDQLKFVFLDIIVNLGGSELKDLR